MFQQSNTIPNILPKRAPRPTRYDIFTHYENISRGLAVLFSNYNVPQLFYHSIRQKQVQKKHQINLWTGLLQLAITGYNGRKRQID